MAERARADIEREIQGIQQRFSGELGLAAKNLRTGEELRVNAETLLPTASVIKVAILVEVFAQEAAGRLALTERLPMTAAEQVGGSGVLKVLGAGLQPTIYDLATLMIVLSDNTATNMLIDRVGGVAAVNRRVQEEYGLRFTVLHNRVDFEKIGSDVRRFAESTPADLLRLMELLARGEIVSSGASQRMLEILGRQQYLDQAPRYVNYNPYAQDIGLSQDITVQNKTGFFPGTGVDAGVMHLPEGTAIAYCVMAHGARDTTIANETEVSVTNGLVGRALVSYWWPRDDVAAAVHATCYHVG